MVQAECERRQWPEFHGFCQYLTGIPSRQGLLCQLRCPSFLGLLSFLCPSVSYSLEDRSACPPTAHCCRRGCKTDGKQWQVRMSRGMDHNPARKTDRAWPDAPMLPHAEIKAGCHLKTSMPRYAWTHGVPAQQTATSPVTVTPAASHCHTGLSFQGFQVPGSHDGEISGP